MNFDTIESACPYCGEILVLEFDPSMGSNQIFEEDCHVCCKCISVHLKYSPKKKRVLVRLFTEDERVHQNDDV
jgi:hypothetical protein